MAYKVLVVDDQTMPRQLFEAIINTSQEYELAACLQSAKLVDLYCAKEHIDLILMDIVMNDGSSGLETAEYIKRVYPDTKIIIMTSMADARFLTRARDIGVDSFWYKEVQETPILDIMKRTMEGENVYPDRPMQVMLGQAANDQLTERELDVLQKLVQGYTDKEIAEQLIISYHTVRFHINSLLEKSQCMTRTELAIRAVQSGIVIPDI